MPAELDKNISTAPLSNGDGSVVGFNGLGQLAAFETARWTRRRRSFKQITATAYTIVAGDEGLMLIHANGSASIITVPTDAVMTDFPVGGTLEIMRNGSGALRVNPAAGVTLKTALRPKLRANGSVALLLKTAANTWVLTGDTAD